jgi:glycosyltransferase involved in cell wall biosynthesis
MTTTPTVSICLPTYNSKPFLVEAIDSILAQTYEDFELLISDDHSSDGTEVIAEAYARKDPRVIVWRNEKNLGGQQNYNLCIRKSRGVFIKPFAADDIMMPDLLEKMLGSITKNPGVSLVSCARRIIDANGVKGDLASSFENSGMHNGNEIRVQCLQRYVDVFNLIGEPTCGFFRRAQAGEGFDVSYYHMMDLDLWMRILRDGDFYYFAEPLCYYRKHKDTSTCNNFRSLYYLLDFLRIADKNLDIVSQVYGSRENAYSVVVDHLARFVQQLVDSGVTSREIISKNLLNSCNPLALQAGIAQDAVRPETLSDDEYFRQIVLFSLLNSGETARRLDDTYRELNAKVQSYEHQLAAVYESNSWKLTGVLRWLTGILKLNRG